MNFIYTVAALLGVYICVHHFRWFNRQFLSLSEKSLFDDEAMVFLRGIVTSLGIFHVLSSFVLWACAFDLVPMVQSYWLVSFISLSYFLFAIWHLYHLSMKGVGNRAQARWQVIAFIGIAFYASLGLIR